MQTRSWKIALNGPEGRKIVYLDDSGKLVGADIPGKICEAIERNPKNGEINEWMWAGTDTFVGK